MVISSIPRGDSITGCLVKPRQSDATSFAYNNRNLISGLTSGSGTGAGTNYFQYDGNGNLTQLNDAMGQVTTMAYDGYDRVKSVKDPLGNETIISRANLGNMLTIKRLNSSGTLLRQSTTLNDPLGRMLSRSDKLLETSEDVDYQYGYSNLESGGQMITITDPLGRISKVSKDKEGKVFKEEDAAGNTVDYFYEDGRGNMTRKVENEKTGDSTFATYTTKYIYNAFNKIEKLTENAGTTQEAITTFFYNEKGNLTGSIDAEGHKIYHEYDLFSRKTKTTRELETGERIETHFAYDTGNNLVSITDANNNETRYEYDTVNKRNWLTKVIYPDSTTIEYTYDLNGNVLTEKQRNGTIVTNTYNALNLLTNRVINPASGVLDTTGETYTYDGASRLTKATDNDSTVEFAYDSLNRKISETQNNKLIKYTFDKVNNLTSIQYPNQRIIEREFDLLNRISKIKQGGTDIANMAFIGRTYRMISKAYQNGDVIKYLYDAGRRNTSIDAKNKNNNIINQYAYGYNKVNLKNYEQRLHENNKGDVYSYDALNRIKNVKFNSPEPTDPQTAQFAKAKTYNLDKVDNILKIVENKNNVDAEILTEMMGNNLQLNQYSKFDNWNMTYDANGNTTQKGTQQFAYNYRNQLVHCKDGAKAFNYKYDAFGRQIEKSGSSDTWRYYYAGDQKIEERDGSDNVIRQYVWGNGIDELLRIDRNESGTMLPYYVHTNEIDSTTAITDANGVLVERVSYDVYGVPSFTNTGGQPIASSTIGNVILFQGHELDFGLNLYNYRARFYDPIIGRFTTVDPLGYVDSTNLYQGMNMNPGNYLDPLGLAKIVIDPGHGDIFNKWLDSGTTGINNNPPHEKDIALEMSKIIGDELKMLGHDVYYTRETDISEKRKRLKWRTDISNNLDADYFISIHLNSMSENKNYFWATYSSNAGKELAESIVSKISVKSVILPFLIPIIPDNQFLKIPFQAGYSSVEAKKNKYQVLKQTEAISVLIEAGNIKNPFNNQIINKSNMGKHIAQGIDEVAKENDRKKTMIELIISVFKSIQGIIRGE